MLDDHVWRSLEQACGEPLQFLSYRIHFQNGRLDSDDAEYRFDSRRTENDSTSGNFPHHLDLRQSKLELDRSPIGEFIGFLADPLNPDAFENISGG